MYLYTCLHCFKCNIRCLNRPVRDATIKKSSVELKFSLTVKKDDLFFPAMQLGKFVIILFLSVKLEITLS